MDLEQISQMTFGYKIVLIGLCGVVYYAIGFCCGVIAKKIFG